MTNRIHPTRAHVGPTRALTGTLTVLAFVSVVGHSSAQSPNRFGWVYEPFPTGFGWVVPRSSPPASVSQTVGVTELTIRYSRPAVNGRRIWGGLVPYDRVWRLGANEATVFTTTTDVLVNDSTLKAGSYALFLTLSADGEASLIFNQQPHQWGAFFRNPEFDKLVVPIAHRRTDPVERLTFGFSEVSDTAVTVSIAWERVEFMFDVVVDTPSEVARLTGATFDWQAAFFAASYFFETAEMPEEALRWINASIALEENATAVYLQARVLAALGRYEAAIIAGTKVMEIGNAQQKDLAERHVEHWKAFVADHDSSDR